MSTSVYEAIRSLSIVHCGKRVMVHEGDTVAEGHWMLKQCPNAFQSLQITHDVERKAPADRQAKTGGAQKTPQSDATA